MLISSGGGTEHNLMKIGVIGLGNMGAAMAANLIKAGHQVCVYNRTKSKAQPLVEAGATLADKPSDAASGDAVITMLSNDASVEEVVFDSEGGVLYHQGKKTIHISMSTISPALVERMSEASRAQGVPFVS